jgi:hypothetical protein
VPTLADLAGVPKASEAGLDSVQINAFLATEEADARREAEAGASGDAQTAAAEAAAAVKSIHLQRALADELALMDPNSATWHGFSLLESDVGGCYLAMNFEAPSAPLPVRSMRLDPDGIPVKGMLWKLMMDGSIENLETGLVLRAAGGSAGRGAVVVCDKRDRDADGTLGDTCKWTLHRDGTVENTANGLLLTVSGGSNKTRTPVWLNVRPPKVLGGTTKARRWKFVQYNGEPKDPLYPIHPAYKKLFTTPEQRAVSRAAAYAAEEAEEAAAVAHEAAELEFEHTKNEVERRMAAEIAARRQVQLKQDEMAAVVAAAAAAERTSRAMVAATLAQEAAEADPLSLSWHGYALIESALGECFVTMNFEAPHAPLPVRSMRLDPDGIPVKGMLWKLMMDGSIENLETGLVLQTASDSTDRKVGVVCDIRDRDPDGRLGQTCKWFLNADGTLQNAGCGMLLTVSGGSKADRTEIWLNARPLKLLGGATKAMKWAFKPYRGEPKNPSYLANPAFRDLLLPKEGRLARTAPDAGERARVWYLAAAAQATAQTDDGDGAILRLKPELTAQEAVADALGSLEEGNAAERGGEVVAKDYAHWTKKTPEQQNQLKADAAEAEAQAKRALAEAQAKRALAEAKVAESKKKVVEFEQAKRDKATAAAAAQVVAEEDAADQARATLRQRQDRASFPEHDNKAEAANARAEADSDAAVTRLVEKKLLEQAGIRKRPPPPRARASGGGGLTSGAAAKRPGSRGAGPAGSRGVSPAGSRGVSPAFSRGFSPAGSRGVSPAGSRGVSPAFSRGLSPAGSRGFSPAGSRAPLRSASVGSKARSKKSDVENI